MKIRLTLLITAKFRAKKKPAMGPKGDPEGPDMKQISGEKEKAMLLMYWLSWHFMARLAFKYFRNSVLIFKLESGTQKNKKQTHKKRIFCLQLSLFTCIKLKYEYYEN